MKQFSIEFVDSWLKRLFYQGKNISVTCKRNQRSQQITNFIKSRYNVLCIIWELKLHHEMDLWNDFEIFIILIKKLVIKNDIFIYDLLLFLQLYSIIILLGHFMLCIMQLCPNRTYCFATFIKHSWDLKTPWSSMSWSVTPQSIAYFLSPTHIYLKGYIIIFLYSNAHTNTRVHTWFCLPLPWP